MSARRSLALATIALFASAATAGAQGASLAVGAAVPAGDLANTAGTGIDIQLQVRTEPMIGPLSLRIEIGYDRFAGKGASASTTFSGQAVSIMGDFGSLFYWAAGPGYYQSSQTTQISGHNVVDQRSYLGAQAALGMNIPVFRWQGFLEVAGVKAFTPGVSLVYLPLRFGVRL
jgi:hypothetical protein